MNIYLYYTFSLLFYAVYIELLYHIYHLMTIAPPEAIMYDMVDYEKPALKYEVERQ